MAATMLSECSPLGVDMAHQAGHTILSINCMSIMTASGFDYMVCFSIFGEDFCICQMSSGMLLWRQSMPIDRTADRVCLSVGAEKVG